MHFPQRRAFVLGLGLVVIIGVTVYARHVTTNPAGFFVDESSAAYNAFTIAQTGSDEYGAKWPLYFRAFGDYKNPVYIYLLALIFRFTGPSILVARTFSAMLGVSAALALALIAYQLSRQRWLALSLMAMALATPWLFAVSRPVVEVALYPAVVALFLFAVARVVESERWSWLDALAISSALALVTYTYSIGRLLGPLLAFGLICFIRSPGLPSVLRAWFIYAITLVPLVIFRWRHPGALDARFSLISYLAPETGVVAGFTAFGQHLLRNLNPWRMLVTGEPSSYQIATTYGTGPVLLVTFVLAVAGVSWLVIKRGLNAWWAFTLYGLFCSFVPASLTKDEFHTLRLSAVPIFLLVLTIPALEWVMKSNARQLGLAIVLILTIGQGAYFQFVYYRHARDESRLHMFDADYESGVLRTALTASGGGPIYVDDTPAIPGYIQAKWYATLEGLPPEKLVILPPHTAPPDNAIVISTKSTCDRCQILFERSPYRVYVLK